VAGLRLGGLASGLDTEAVIAGLMAIERRPQARLTGLERRAEARKSGLEEIAARLRTLTSAANDLKSASLWAPVQSTSSSDPARVDVRQLAGAAVGSYVVEVTRLARAEQRFYDYTADPDASEITIGDVTVTIPAGADAAQAAEAINARVDAGAYATVVAGQLVLSGKATGAALSVSGAQLTEDVSRHRPAQTAAFTIDGDSFTSTSNTVTGEIPGLELSLKSLTNGPVTVTAGAPGPDLERIKEKVKAFVEAYNATIDLIGTRTRERPVAQPTIMLDWAKGALHGDSGLTSLIARMRQTVGEHLGPLAIGVGFAAAQEGPVSQDRLQGRMVFDDAKLTEALTADPAAVRAALGGENALVDSLAALIAPAARSGDGELALRASEVDGQIARLKQQSAGMERRLALKEQRLRAQFSAMETALAASQAQGQWLLGQLNGLNSLRQQ
jgi:flagellar hook-associated protein 2